MLDKSPSADPTLNYNILEDILCKLKNKHFQSKFVKFNKYKHKKSPWITTSISRSVKFRNQLYKQFRKAPVNSEEACTLRTNLKTYNGIIKKCIIRAKSNYYTTHFENYKGDIKMTWSVINDALNRNAKPKQNNIRFKINDEVITDKQIIANKFNIFFVNIGPSLSKEIKAPSNKFFCDYLTKRYQLTFEFETVHEETIFEHINELKNKNSTGKDGISSKLLKTIKTSLIKPLTLIFNQMLITGIFPERLKIAKVLPLYKKDDKVLLNNYRPISLLSVISKIFDRIIYNQLYSYFENKNILYSGQYGFRIKHSTELASLEVIETIISQMDTNKIPLGIFLDLSKAFDTLDHEILITKLNYYGIKKLSNKLLRNYLPIESNL